MTDPIIIDAGIVGFSEDDRLVTGMLLPYGEQCRSSVGMFTFDAGVCEIPQDVPGIVGFNIEHERDQAVGRGVTVTETPQGLIGAFRVADGPEGDAALADIKSGKRKHLSAEVTALRIKGGKAIGARLFGAALVEKPAFASAALFAAADTDAAAADTDEPEGDALDPTQPHTIGDDIGDGWTVSDVSQMSYDSEQLGDDGEYQPTTRTTYRLVVTKGDETRTAERSVETPRQQNDSQEGTEMTTQAPLGFSAPHGTTHQQQTNGTADVVDVGKAAFFAAAAETRLNGNFAGSAILSGIHERDARLGMFALPDATYDKTAGDLGKIYRPQYLQEIWEGDDDPAERRIIPLLDHGDLTELYFDDSEWEVKATVSRWAGNKSNVTGTSPKRKRNEPEKAQGFAGGLDIALEHKFFNHAEDIETYVGQMRDSYAIESDKYVAEKLLELATLSNYSAVSGVRGVFAKLVQGILKTRRVGKAQPTFALLAPDMYEEFLYTPHEQVLEFLAASAGVDEGTFAGIRFEEWDQLPAGGVFVGARKAVKVLELPGVPIRLNALDLAKGGHDEALFGFVGVRRQRPLALNLIKNAA